MHNNVSSELDNGKTLPLSPFRNCSLSVIRETYNLCTPNDLVSWLLRLEEQLPEDDRHRSPHYQADQVRIFYAGQTSSSCCPKYAVRRWYRRLPSSRATPRQKCRHTCRCCYCSRPPKTEHSSQQPPDAYNRIARVS